MTITDYGYDISFGVSQGTWHLSDDESLRLYDQMKNAEGVYKASYENLVDSALPVPRSAVTERYLEFSGYGDSSDETITPYMGFHFIDDEEYRRYMETLGLDPAEYGMAKGKFPAIAKDQGYEPTSQRTISVDIFKEDSITIDIAKEDRPLQWKNMPAPNITLTIVDAMPEGLSQSQIYEISVFVPYSDKDLFGATEEDFRGIRMTFSSDDPIKSVSEMDTMIEAAGITEGYTLFNIAEVLERNRNLILIINIFTYGFVILISLITIANVFNTVSTSISLRRREFAMLRSIGMDNRGFNSMMNFECLFYGLKALLYGLPISVLVTYLIYKSVENGVDVDFTLPWGSIAISIFSVFFVVFVTMMYASSKIKKANVIDALRSE
jgi:putative ABC transport system permease protein